MQSPNIRGSDVNVIGWLDMIKIVKPEDVELKKLTGRDMRLTITEETVGAEELSLGIIWVEPGSIVKPCHAHLKEEEVLYIEEGNGEVWVDKEIKKVNEGNFVFFPKGSKHMVRNTGKKRLKVVFIYAPPTDPSKYKLYPETDFK